MTRTSLAQENSPPESQSSKNTTPRPTVTPKKQEWHYQNQCYRPTLRNKKYNALKIQELALHWGREKELQEFRKSIKVPYAMDPPLMNKTLSLKSFKVRSVRVHPVMAVPCKDKRRTHQFIQIKKRNQTIGHAESERQSQEAKQPEETPKSAEEEFVKYNDKPEKPQQ